MKSSPFDPRIAALRRFALAITALNILGHTVFGFEQSWAHPLVALATAYSMELGLEWLDARAQQRRPRFLGGPRTLIDFLLSAHITGLAVAMLLYTNARLAPVAFAVAVAIGSKALFRVKSGAGTRHFFNPSNFGISVTLLAFPWVGIAPPYQFTENLDRIGDVALPALIIVTGTLLNFKLTGRGPLIIGWLGGFVAQAYIRNVLFGAAFLPALMPMTGVAFILFTFYMVTDPGTTPRGKQAQLVYGIAVAAVYGVLVSRHIVFGTFFALTLVSAARACGIVAMRIAGTQRAARFVPRLGRPVRREAKL